MNKTSYIILKLLSQQSLSEEELLKYIPMSNLNLIKSIYEINILLEKLSLPTIKKNNNEYFLNLTITEKEILLKNCSSYSQNQRYNYLMLKLFIEKKINLEYEKEILNISRSTIKRDLEKIKEFCLENNINLTSIKWQGVFLETDNFSQIYSKTCEILIKFYYELDLLPKELKNYLQYISKNKNKDLITNLYSTFNIFDLKIGDLVLTYLLALEDCFQIFKDFYLEIIEKQFEKLKIKSDFEKIFKTIKETNYYTTKYSKYISVILWNIINYTFPQEKNYFNTIKSFEKIFNISLNKKEQYLLSVNIFYGTFKKNNNIYTVKKFEYKDNDKQILYLLDNFFNSANIDVFYGDKLILLDLIKLFFKYREISNSYSILIIKKEINQENVNQIETILKQLYPNFKFTIESYLFFKLNHYKEKNYNLILTDSILSYKIPYKLFKYNFEIPSLIDEYLIENFFNKIK